jgi:hypothetical protein
MCFTAEIPEGVLDDVIDYCCAQLRALSVPESDPGLCVAVTERLRAPQELIAFGRKAKKHILSKIEAYALAESLSVHLSEQGGTGQGVIGALAGAGLRLSGNDGRFSGKIRLVSSQAGFVFATSARLASNWSRHWRELSLTMTLPFRWASGSSQCFWAGNVFSWLFRMKPGRRMEGL